MNSSAAEFQVQPLFADLPPAKPVAPAPGASQRRASTRPGRESYFNTTNLVGTDLQEKEGKALGLEQRIEAWFRNRPGRAFGPSQVLDEFPGAIINSVRRAMTNLTTRKVLVRLDDKRIGLHGNPEHLWRLRTESTLRDCA